MGPPPGRIAPENATSRARGAGGWSVLEEGREPELVEQVRVQEVVVAGDLAVLDLDHLQRPRVPATGAGRLVGAEGGGAVGPHGQQLRPGTADAGAGHPAGDLVG